MDLSHISCENKSPGSIEMQLGASCIQHNNKTRMHKSTNFPLKNKINKDFNLKNTILFFGFQKKYYLCIRNQ